MDKINESLKKEASVKFVSVLEPGINPPFRQAAGAGGGGVWGGQHVLVRWGEGH